MTAVILLFASAMAVAQEQDVGSRSQRPIPAPVEFRCAPKVLTATDTLTLTFSGPHGAELGVWAPDTRFLFIAFVQETPQSVPPIRGEEFAQMRSLKLSVKGATGLDYIGSSEPRVIFSVPGTYRFILADNLETEAAFGGHQPCEVRFASKADAGRGTKAQSVLTSGRAVAALSKARPGTDWKRSLRSDVDCDGTLDDVFIAQDTTEFHVGVVFAGGYPQTVQVTLTIELECEEDGRWIAEVLALPGVLRYGQDRDEAVAGVQALALHVIAERLEKREAPAEFLNVTFQADRLDAR